MRRFDSALLDRPAAVALMLPLLPAGQKPAGIHRAQLSPALLHILQETQRELGCGAEGAEQLPTVQDTAGTIQRVSARLGFELSHYERDQILAYIESDQKPFGLLQEIVNDKRVTDIIVSDYSKIAVQQGRVNLKTDLAFPSQDAYEAFVERLLKKAGTSISTKKPIADGMLGTFARLHAVHKSLCDGGPYLTIRINRFSEVCCKDLEQNGMAPEAVFNYLTALVRTGHTMLIVGEVATGKTTLCRALAGSIPPEEAILVIEDTPEIKLTHPHVRYIRTREANNDGAGRVSPSECIRAGMRMAMNRIIFGEMRDAEAAEAFVDVCASGHPGLSTIHGRSCMEAITRLELFLGRAQRGVSAQVLTRQVSTAVQIIVTVGICGETGERRVLEVKEIGAVADGALRQKDMFKYEVQNGFPAWRVCCRVSAHRAAIENCSAPAVLSALPEKCKLAA